MKACSNTHHSYWLALVIFLPSWTNGVKTLVKKQCCKSSLSLPMKAKPTARKMYVLYFTCLSHPLKIDGTSEGHRFKQEHHSLQVPDPDLWMHCVCFSEKFWPPKHMRVPGLGLVAAGLACLFSSYDGLLDGQGEGGETMSPRRPEGLWVKTVSEGRADSTGKSN